MKKVLSSIVAALVALSFAGIVCAAEPVVAPVPAAADVKKEEKAAKPAKKHAKKAKKAKKETVPADAAAPAVK
jgi:hypothetical protein